MHWFATIFLLVYSLFHALLYWGLRRLLPSGWKWSLGIITWLGLMQAAPIIHRVLENYGYDSQAKLVAQAGYIWMGFVILALVTLGLLHLLRAPAKLFFKNRKASAPMVPGRRRAIITLAAAPALAAYGLWESSRVRISRVALSTPKLPQHIKQLKIALISDVHLGLMTDPEWLDEVLAGIEREKPDLVVSAGDLLDGRMPGMTDLAARLGRVSAPMGKYAVLGNHEYYVGLGRSLDCHQKAGFQLLRGQALTVGGCLNIAGVDDTRQPYGQADAAILDSLPGDLFTLFLRHRPLVPAETLGLFDLQLSGHTHGGQISPFGLLVRLQFPYLAGGYHLDKGSGIYVSRGTGTWGPPMRVAAPPEITLVELTRQTAIT